MNVAKWIHVKIQGWKGLATVLVPEQTTVAEFKVMLGLDARNLVTVPASFLPLAGDIDLHRCVNEFDTIVVER